MGLFGKHEEAEAAKEAKKLRLQQLQERISQYKPSRDKNGVIQYKNERIAILQRVWGQQVEFIIAYDDLTKEGYRCIAHDEGKEGGGSGLTGGLNSFFYFQKMEFVR